ncbi:MAG: hypothetical protein A2W35_00800 [Chloroflexi bacterium RBG_16_57_11]|nr:MAG: hypothetical protein A2W35_00800 [Chloroflexi bacterium RBG_16_57_11]
MAGKYLFISLCILVLISSTWQSSLAQGGEEYFDETGHVVTGEFLAAYRSVPNPVQLYGYPITDAFQDTTRNLLVQYFQKTRFELNPAGPVGNRVKISPLGEYLYTPGPEAHLYVNPGACRTYPPGGYQVCLAFLNFYDQHGGQKQFGLPISNAELHDGRTVQYFQNARFEYSPELPAGQRIVLAHLGSQYFDRHGEDPTLLLPDQGGNTITSIRSLRARAFPEQAVTGKTGSQTVYITVQDQRLLPVANAQVALILEMPDNQENHFMVPALTNDAGITHFSFPFSAEKVGMATIKVVVLRGDLEADTTTSFRLWW